MSLGEAATTHRMMVIRLYKTLLRLHRGLPEELRLVGTPYLKDEFRRHKNADHQLASIFISEWTKYAIVLAKQLSVKGIKTQTKVGSNMEMELLDKFREDQIVQLHQLMKATISKEEKVK